MCIRQDLFGSEKHESKLTYSYGGRFSVQSESFQTSQREVEAWLEAWIEARRNYWCREEHPPRREPIGLLGQSLGKEVWFRSSRAAVGRSACGEGAEKDCILSTTSKSSFKWNQPYNKPSFKWHLTSSSSLIRFVPWSPHRRFPFFQAPFPDTSFYMKISLSSGPTHASHFLCLDHCWENWVLPMPAYCHLSMRF